MWLRVNCTWLGVSCTWIRISCMWLGVSGTWRQYSYLGKMVIWQKKLINNTWGTGVFHTETVNGNWA
ncbi:MAG: hypothetical protein IH595_04355 [Bacteroidales bacterium]|nr:hypothetical protein [Bacteroidales bacterium]